MFVLRTQHIEAFEQGYREAFEDRMVRHVDAKFPVEFDKLGEDKVRRRIREGVERAERYEIREQPHVARFIRFMFALGPDFDTARKTAWVREILKDTSVPPAERLDKVRETARVKRQEAEDT